jgi:hypothetical protein
LIDRLPVIAHIPPHFWHGVNNNHNVIYLVECLMDSLIPSPRTHSNFAASHRGVPGEYSHCISVLADLRHRSPANHPLTERFCHALRKLLRAAIEAPVRTEIASC